MMLHELVSGGQALIADGIGDDTQVMVKCPNHGSEDARPAVVCVRKMLTANGERQVVTVQCYDCAEVDA